MGLNSSSGAYAGHAKTVLPHQPTKRNGTKCGPMTNTREERVPYHHERNGAQYQDLSVIDQKQKKGKHLT